MKVERKFTHRCWFYGCSVYVAFESDGGFMPLPVIPGTGWWIDHVAPFIQWARASVAGVLGIPCDEDGAFRLDRITELDKPFTKTFEWPDCE